MQDLNITVLELGKPNVVEVMEGGEVAHMMQSKYLV